MPETIPAESGNLGRMGDLDKVRERRRRARFPWIPLILLLGTIYLFWILPRMMPAKPVKVEFGNSTSEVDP